MSSTLTVYQWDTTSVDFFSSPAPRTNFVLSQAEEFHWGPIWQTYMAIVINRRMNSLVKCNSSSADNCLFVWTAWMIPWSMECHFAIVLRNAAACMSIILCTPQETGEIFSRANVMTLWCMYSRPLPPTIPFQKHVTCAEYRYSFPFPVT